MAKVFFECAANVGCTDSKGNPLWDSQKVRGENWAVAQYFVKAAQESPLTYQKFFFSVPDRVQNARSSKALDDLEIALLGEIFTSGSYPKRVRFWRFVGLISRGITPRDIK